MKKIQISLFTRILFMSVALLAFGLLMIYSASVAEALRDFGTKWYFVNLQLKRAGLGLLLLFLVSLVKPKFWERYGPTLFVIGLVLLVLVLIPGLGSKVQGARRWLALPGFALQPAELIKFFEITYLATWLTRKEVSLRQFLAYVAGVTGLILFEPDMGTSIVVALIAVSMYFLAGYPVKSLLWVGATGAVLGAVLILGSPYRLERLKTFLDAEHDPSGSAYHIRQVVLALGSGGLTGVGVGKSRQKYEYLPEATTDSIFAVVGEELGFIGGVGLIACFTYLITLIFRVAASSRDRYSALLASGIGAWITIQVSLNLSAMVALAPLTGVPLPLVSYGGSSLITIMLGLGTVLSVARHERL